MRLTIRLPHVGTIPAVRADLETVLPGGVVTFPASIEAVIGRAATYAGASARYTVDNVVAKGARAISIELVDAAGNHTCITKRIGTLMAYDALSTIVRAELVDKAGAPMDHSTAAAAFIVDGRTYPVPYCNAAADWRLAQAIEAAGYQLASGRVLTSLVDGTEGIMLWRVTAEPHDCEPTTDASRAELTLDGLRVRWAGNARALEELGRFAGKCALGTRLWVYGWPWCYGVTVTGLVPNHVEEIFGGSEADVRPRFVAPLIAYVRDDTGEAGTVGPMVAVPREKAALLWSVLDADGFLIQGNVDSVIRAKQIVDDNEPGCLARLGLPPDGQYDVCVDDGAGFSDPDVAARYEADVARLRAVAQSTAGPGPGLDETQIQTTQTQTEASADALTITGPGPVSPGLDGPGPGGPGPGGPVSFGYRLTVQTDGTWREVRTAHTPPIFRPVQTTLDAIADSILGNARPVLGLGPKDPMPPVRVVTWHLPSGLVGSASRMGSPRPLTTKPRPRKGPRLMRFEINKLAIQRWRLRLAQFVAPHGADVHDPDDTCCPKDQDILNAAFWGDLRLGLNGTVLMDVTEEVDDLISQDLVEPVAGGWWRLTDAGEQELARLWGPGRLPPWSVSWHGCGAHGLYEAHPGEFGGCRECRHEQALQHADSRATSWWSLRRLVRASQ